jgi:hypothetical protein
MLFGVFFMQETSQRVIIFFIFRKLMKQKAEKQDNIKRNMEMLKENVEEIKLKEKVSKIENQKKEEIIKNLQIDKDSNRRIIEDQKKLISQQSAVMEDLSSEAIAIELLKKKIEEQNNQMEDNLLHIDRLNLDKIELEEVNYIFLIK